MRRMDQPPYTPAGADFVALRTGQTVGRYEVLGVLGHGGFGITYRALDRQLGREVALKEYLPAALAVRQDGTTVMPRSPAAADDFSWGRARFVEEGRTLARLQKSPAIVRVFDFLEVNGTAYIVMELVHGETLEHLLHRGGPLSPAAVERLLWPLLDGLARVHAHGFLHRDIKPANILIDEEGDPTLIDFGASRAAIADRSSVLTAVFTPGYAAAEQVTSARQGPWTDIYALSATLYRAIRGRPPPNVFDRMVADRYEPLELFRPPGFSLGLLQGIDAGLAVKAGERPQSIAAWRTVIGKTAAGDNDVTVVLRAARPLRGTVPEIPVARPRSRTNIVKRALAAAASVALVAGGVVWLAGGRDRQAPETEAASAPSAADTSKVQSFAAAPQGERDERKAAESAEANLRLGVVERQKVQMALTAAGFDTRGSDGTFGPRSREMIAAWQKAQSQPATGFLTAAQFQDLLRRGEEERRKVEDEARARSVTNAPALPASTPAPAAGPFDGTYVGFFSPSGPVALRTSASPSIALRIANGTGSGTMTSTSCGAAPLSVRISPSGAITGDAQGVDASCARFPLVIHGQASNGQLRMTFGGAVGGGSADLSRGAPSPPQQAVTPRSAASPFDGSYVGSLAAVDTGGISRVLTAELDVRGDRLSGRISSPTCGSVTIALAISAGGDVAGEVRLQANQTCSPIALGVQGRVLGDRLTLDLRGAGLRIQGTLSRRAG